MGTIDISNLPASGHLPQILPAQLLLVHAVEVGLLGLDVSGAPVLKFVQ